MLVEMPQMSGAGGRAESGSSTPLDSPQSGSPALSAATSGAASGTPEEGRYFLMRCNNQKIVDVSENKSIWATTAANEAKLNRAYSVNDSLFRVGKVYYCFNFVIITCTSYIFAEITNGTANNC